MQFNRNDDQPSRVQKCARFNSIIPLRMLCFSVHSHLPSFALFPIAALYLISVKSDGVKSETLAEHIVYAYIANVSAFNLPVCGDDMLDDGLI